jgi:hypothetical protein
MRSIETKLGLLIAATAGITLLAADGPASAIPTFESLGLYYNRPVAKECKVQYRVAGAATWHELAGLRGQERSHQHRQRERHSSDTHRGLYLNDAGCSLRHAS